MSKTRFVLISDTHGHRPSLPEGDVLLHAGDHTMVGSRKQTEAAFEWLGIQATRFKSVCTIGGNHDFFLELLTKEAGVEATRAFVHKFGDNILYLENELAAIPTVHGPVFIYGSPITPTFGEWAWNRDRGEAIREEWAKIPPRGVHPWAGVDILMTHGPAHGILDWVGKQRVGCEDLREALAVVQPRLHVFGHIHMAYGKGRAFTQGGITTESYNVAVCGESNDYTSYQLDPKHKPWVLDFDGLKFVEAQDVEPQ
jgi:predicted phosphodiesterase